MHVKMFGEGYNYLKLNNPVLNIEMHLLNFLLECKFAV